MRRETADQMRHIVQNHTMLRDPLWRRMFLALLDLDEEEDQETIRAVDQFMGHVANHDLEKLVELRSPKWPAMNNLQVAQMMVKNTLAYAGYKDAVEANMTYVDIILQKPHEINKNYTWEHFK